MNQFKTETMKTTEDKNHYRKVFKSNHLGVADLEEFIEEGRPLNFTIKEVKQFLMDSNNKNSGVVVAGKRMSANVAYFEEPIKPMVLNSTNSKIIKTFNGGSSFVEDWKNTSIELYIDSNVKMKGDVVGGVRIRPVQPQKRKPELTPEHKRWDDAKKAISEGREEGVLKLYTVSPENLKKLKA